MNDFHFGKNNFSSVFDLLACNSIKGEEKIENLSKKLRLFRITACFMFLCNENNRLG